MNLYIFSSLHFRKTGELYLQTYSRRYIPQLVKQSLTKMCYFQLLLDGRFEISKFSSIVWGSFLNTNFTNIFSHKIMLRCIEAITDNLVPTISSLQQSSSQYGCCFSVMFQSGWSKLFLDFQFRHLFHLRSIETVRTASTTTGTNRGLFVLHNLLLYKK